jgi:hypothetical protein
MEIVIQMVGVIVTLNNANDGLECGEEDMLDCRIISQKRRSTTGRLVIPKIRVSLKVRVFVTRNE